MLPLYYFYGILPRLLYKLNVQVLFVLGVTVLQIRLKDQIYIVYNATKSNVLNILNFSISFQDQERI